MNDRFARVKTVLLRSTAFLTLLVFATGCGIFSPDESDPPDDGGGTTPASFALSRADLMQNFRTSWEDRNIDLYELVLNDDFQFEFSQQDINANPGRDPRWDRAREIQTAEFIFDVRPSPGQAPPTQITFSVFEPSVTFRAVTDEEEALFEGAEEVGRYDVQISFSFDALTLAVSGEQEFFIKREPEQIAGATVDTYQLVGWKDLAVINPN